MGNKKKIVRTLKGVALIAIGAVVFSFAMTAIYASVEFDLTPTVFQPVKNAAISYDVYDENYNWLDTITIDENSPRRFTDPTNTYPNADIFFSNAPYVSDAAGNPISTPGITTVEKHIFGTQVLFQHKAYFTMDFGARTYTNLPDAYLTSTVAINPLKGQTVTYQSGSCTIQPTRASDNAASFDDTNKVALLPRGSMLASIDCGYTPWRVWAGGTARISQSLVPIDFDGEAAGTPNTGYSFNDAMTKMATQFGNSGLIIRPRISVSAWNNFERYDYTREATLSNGTKVYLSLVSKSAMVGFENAVTKNDPYADLVPKVYDEQFLRAGLTGSTAASGQSPARSPGLDNVPEAASDIMFSSLTYVGDEPAFPNGKVITRTIEPLNVWTSMDDSTTSIIWNDILAGKNPLPETVDMNADFALRPQTTVKIAQVQYTGVNAIKAFNGWWFLNPIIYADRIERTYSYPYAIMIDNVAAMQSVVMAVDLFTVSEVQMVTSTGLPVDISKLVDFDLGSIINNPGADDLVFSTRTETFDFWEWLTGGFDVDAFMNILIVVAVIIGALAVLTIVIKMQFKRKD